MNSDVNDTIYSWGVGFWVVVIGLSLLILVGSIAIARKAGYSGWWGALFALVWPVSWLLFGLFAVFKWPIIKERDEALRVLKENNLVTPSQMRHAEKAAKSSAALAVAVPVAEVSEAPPKGAEPKPTEPKAVEAEKPEE